MNGEKDLSNELNLLKKRISGLEKHVADKELQLEKSKLMTKLLDSATDSVFLHDFDGNFVYVNESAYKTRGYTKEELMGMNLHDLDVPQYEELIEPRIKELMEKGESFFETAHFRKDGSQLPVEIHSRIIEYDNKSLVLSYVRDITERKKVENALVSAKEQYKTLLDNIGVGIAFISPNMEILELNDQMKEWFPHIDVSKKPICYDAFNVPPREDICTYCPTYKTLEDGKIHESTTDTPMGDEIINYRVVSSPIKDNEGKVVAAIEMVEDITTRKRMEAELKRAYATFNSIFEGPENIIAFSLDRNYQYIFFNQAHSQTMKNIWGVDIEIGKSMLDYISYPDDREKAKISFDRALSGENFIELEDYGEETLSRRYWENIYNPIQSGNEIIGLTMFCIDITERQKADENLRQSEEKFRAVAESAIDAIITADSKGIITFFNHSLLELFGYSASELSGKPVSILIPEVHKNGHLKGMHSFRLGKRFRTGKTSTAVGLKKDGTEFPCEMSLSIWKSGENTYFTSIIRDINERKKAEKLLKESEEKFRAIFQNANDMISLNLMNEDGMPGKFLEVNDVASERLGYTHDELLNMSPPDIVAPENRSEMPKNAAMLIEKGHNTFEIVHLTKTGERIPVEVNNHLINYKGQGVCLAISRDITERKIAEKALKESEEKYRTIFENVQDIFFQTDIKGKIIEISPSIEKYFQISPKELVGNHVDKLYFNPEDRKKLLNVLQEKGEVSDYEITLKNSKNRLIYISANVHFIFDSKNRPIGIEGALRDITERKKAEDELKLSQIRLENAMDLADLANWELDAYNRMFIFNDKFYSMLGTTADNEGGYSMSIEYYVKKYVHPEDAQFIAEGMKKSLDIREPTFGTDFQHRIIRRDGKTRYLAIHIRVIPATESQSARVYGAVQDITEHKIIEEKLKESLEEKEMLLKEIHHRVKNNLMVISSLLNLQSQYIKDKEALDIFKESQNRAKSMALIHERLYRSTDLKKIDFGDYIHTLATDLFHTYVTDPSRVKLHMDLENVMVDINTTVPLGLIVNELVTNSMKHAFPDGEKGEINIEFHKQEDEFILLVSDTGVGFPEEIDFRKTDSLGLQLVNNLVMQIDGVITLDMINGTEFKIIFKEVEYKKKI